MRLALIVAPATFATVFVPEIGQTKVAVDAARSY